MKKNVSRRKEEFKNIEAITLDAMKISKSNPGKKNTTSTLSEPNG